MSKELAKEIHAKAAPFITWLKEAEEESEEEELVCVCVQLCMPLPGIRWMSQESCFLEMGVQERSRVTGWRLMMPDRA